MEIRKATRDDARAVFDVRIAAIHSQCAGHYDARDLAIWTSGTMSDRFVSRVEDDFHVAIVDGVVVGTGMVDLHSGRVDGIFVHPDHMRRGIGRRMMAHLEDLAREAGLSELSLDATLNAAAFYRSLGFVGEAVATYESSLGVSLDCIPMTKSLRRA